MKSITAIVVLLFAVSTVSAGEWKWNARTGEWTETKADKPTSTVERYAGVYEWTGSTWKWTSDAGKTYWHDGTYWRENRTSFAEIPQKTRPAPRGPQNRYGIQWAR